MIAPAQKEVLFVSTMGAYPWGGSEELWSRTALDLVVQGFAVTASVLKWSPLHHRVQNLMHCGVEVQLRPWPCPVWKLGWIKVFSKHKSPIVAEVNRLLATKRPALVVLSDGGWVSPIGLLEQCVARGLPFVTIGQANSEEGSWIEDELAERYRKALHAAVRCFFVSKANQRLAEKQLGCELSNAEVVWNPVNVNFDASPSWPSPSPNEELRFACVARLHPPSKGQDILLEALAGPTWVNRSWRLTLYGEGPMKNIVERYIKRLGLQERVAFAGHVSMVEEIWARNHVLVMPSRYEGLPLAMIEAMLCARAVLATDVAGHSEIIEDGVTGWLADAATAPAVARALERAWAERGDLEKMGKAAARSIRRLLPPDPVRVFSDKIKALACIRHAET